MELLPQQQGSDKYTFTHPFPYTAQTTWMVYTRTENRVGTCCPPSWKHLPCSVYPKTPSPNGLRCCFPAVSPGCSSLPVFILLPHATAFSYFLGTEFYGSRVFLKVRARSNLCKSPEAKLYLTWNKHSVNTHLV